MSGAMWSTSFGAAAQSSMDVYESVMVPRMFAPWAALLLDELELAAGEAVLDVACGPGSVARMAAARVGASGRVIGCDLSPAMLAIAAAKPAVSGGGAIEYHEAPADRLPVDDGAFDVVTCQQGLQFLPDRPAALAEMRRALRSGGRLGIAVWAEIDRSPPFRALGDALEVVAGVDLAERFRGGPWGFPDGERLGALLEQAGFDEVRVSRRVLPLTFEGGAAQLLSTLAPTPVAPEIDRLSDEQQQLLVATVAHTMGDGPIVSQLESNVALARRA
ncbi:MAG: class I SAM-dependent methyltransferase [Solirubrobacteraceae bacterium]